MPGRPGGALAAPALRQSPAPIGPDIQLAEAYQLIAHPQRVEIEVMGIDRTMLRRGHHAGRGPENQRGITGAGILRQRALAPGGKPAIRLLAHINRVAPANPAAHIMEGQIQALAADIIRKFAEIGFAPGKHLPVDRPVQIRFRPERVSAPGVREQIDLLQSGPAGE